MRVLYVIDSLAPGGAETSLAELAPDLIRLRVELHVLPLGTRRDLAGRLQDAGAVLHPGPARASRLGNVRCVLDAARRLRPDLVHTTLYEADVAGRTAARLAGVPCSTSLVNDSYGASHYAETNTAKLHAARAVDALTATLATRFHAITQAIADSVPPRIGVPARKVEVIPRGRRPEAFPFRTPQARAEARHGLGLDADAPVVLTIGRLEPQKGLQHLLAALPQVAREHPGLVTLIAGKDGRAAEALRAQAAASGLDVRFLGHRTDVVGLLTAADVFCFPSEREGFGGVLIEALAVGCPIVASDIPTTREVLRLGPGYAGLVTAVGDAVALGAGLDAALRARDSGGVEAGRQLFEQRFTIGAVSAQLAAFFRAAAQGGGR